MRTIIYLVKKLSSLLLFLSVGLLCLPVPCRLRVAVFAFLSRLWLSCFCCCVQYSCIQYDGAQRDGESYGTRASKPPESSEEGRLQATSNPHLFIQPRLCLRRLRMPPQHLRHRCSILRRQWQATLNARRLQTHRWLRLQGPFFAVRRTSSPIRTLR